MDAGRALDKQVAEKVFGWVDFWEAQGYVMGYPPNEQAIGIEAERAHVPHYSTEISAAWEVVETMGAFHGLRLSLDRWGGDPWWAEFADDQWIHGAQFTSTTAPHAICMAALNALEDMAKR